MSYRHSVVGSLWLVVAMALVGCSSLTDALNRRADGSTSPEDRQLRMEVQDRLRDDPMTGAHAIGVVVQDGVVQLRGMVPDAETRLRALGVARGTPGVRAVDDQLAR